MSDTTKQILITLGLVLVVLLGYESYRSGEARKAREQAEKLRDQAEALARQTKAQTEAMQEQAQQLKQQSEALQQQTDAMKEQVALEHQQAAADQQRYLTRAYRMEGLAAAQSVKVQIASHYMEFGKLPRSNHEAGVAEPEKFSGQSLRSLLIDPDGQIVLTYDEKAGDGGGTIRLIPDTSNPTMVIKWRCASPNFSDIALSIAQCDYDPTLTLPRPSH
jgi:hypothetical protein